MYDFEGKINKNGEIDFSGPPVYNLTKKGNQMQNLMPSVKFNYFYVKTQHPSNFPRVIVDAISYCVDYLYQ